MAGVTRSSDSLNPIVRRILESRGIVGEELDRYLYPQLADLAAAESLPGIAEAAAVILAAVRERRLIVVFGDYDCDGICATAILTRALTALGAAVEPFLPRRLDEGYGMTELSVNRMLKEFPAVGLVITVDNGINSVEQVAALRAKGIQVVVTDHHLPGEELPVAEALVNPKVSAPPELASLCGAAVAFLLAKRMMNEAKRTGLYSGEPIGGALLVLAGLATITDIMPLLGQNRILVAEALAHFRAWAPVGLRELYSRAARSGAQRLAAKDFSFVLGPRINAAGRLKSGMEALELATSDDREIARELARIIDGYNVERKAIEQHMTDAAMAQVVEGASAQVIDVPDGHPGVAGIVAARVMERLGETVPVCVMVKGHGSARSPEGLNIRDAFVACGDCLERFGGHAAAAGLTVKAGCLEEFRRRLCEYSAKFAKAQTERTELKADLWVEPSELTLALAEDVTLMEPFGEANPEPVFGLHAVTFDEVRPLGMDGRHLSLVLSGSGLKVVAWGRGDQIETLRSRGKCPHEMTVTLVISDYGERHVELRLCDLVRSEVAEK